MAELEEMKLTLDETEALRLSDLENKTQEEAARMMGLSQPTFHRILTGARRKVAEALFKGKAIRIEDTQYVKRRRRRWRRREGWRS